jgi:L-ascorbate metabolism protein UlaG (beta-lactamase superfamily)
MNRLFALVLLLMAAAQAPGQDRPLTLQWFGQSFFHLTTSAGTRIVFDPHAIEQYPRVQVSADIVLISHPHLDHATLIPVQNRATANVLHGVKEEGRRQSWNAIDQKFRDARITSVGVFHDKDSGMIRGRNAIFIVEVDGLRIVHLGDLGHELTERQVQAIGPVDILMIPIGGIYTINGSDARNVVKQLKPRRLILPMHYGTKAYDELVGPEEFLDGLKNVVRKGANNELLIDPAADPPAEPQEVLLSWKKGEE